MLEKVGRPGGQTVYRPVIMDFGLAREQNEGKGLTATGTMMGTPAYMPPEQAQGKTELIDRRSDVYSLGATLYEMLAGVPPFDGKSMVDILFKVLNHHPPALRSVLTGAPEPLETIVSKCLNKDPIRRYQSAQELAEDLDRFRRGEPIQGKRLSAVHQLSWRARRNKPVTALLLVLTAMVVGVLAGVYRARQLDAANQQVAQALGQEVERIQWLMRIAYFSPLHDVTKQKEALRALLSKIEADRLKGRPALAGRYHYVLGRGYLVLHDLAQAEEHLQKAEQAGFEDDESIFAQIQLRELKYRKVVEKEEFVSHPRAKDEPGKSKQKLKDQKEDLEAAAAVDYLDRQKKLEEDFFRQIRPYLLKSKPSPKIPQDYLPALIDYEHHEYGSALDKAKAAQQATPWFYEAIRLEGNIHKALAIKYIIQNDYGNAELSFRAAVDCYQRASEFGRSDPQLHESLANALNSLMSLQASQLKSPEPNLDRALAAADHAAASGSTETAAAFQRAQSYLIVAKYLQGNSPSKLEHRRKVIEDAIGNGKEAALLHPDDPEPYRLTGEAYILKANLLGHDKDQPEFESIMDQAETLLNKAISKSNQDPSLYASLLSLYRAKATHALASGADPTAIIEEGMTAGTPSEFKGGNNEYLVQHLLINLLLARYNAEHGKSSEKIIADELEQIRFFKKTKDYRVQSIVASLLCTQALYCLDAQCDVDKLLAEAQRYAQESRDNSHELWPRAYIVKLWAAAIKASSYVQRKKEPAAVIAEGLDAAAACLSHSHEDPACYTHQATLRLAEAQWRLAEGASADEALRRAGEAAKQAVDRATESQRPDALLILARVRHAAAQAQAQARRPVAKLVGAAASAGLEALAAALRSRPDRPHAVAL
ncbi:MAG TPA: serine/threonine-protein kinase, partial [Pseudomonadota bacterium]|nr:serine/threonine-protein kinase [Pseudomonadota bacterium]